MSAKKLKTQLQDNALKKYTGEIVSKHTNVGHLTIEEGRKLKINIRI